MSEQHLKNLQKDVARYWTDVLELNQRYLELNKEFVEKLAKVFKDTYGIK